MDHLLKYRRYMGEYSYRDVAKKNGIPSIVPKELFEQVQERLAKDKKAPARHKAKDGYLLTMKLYCGKCGSFMMGERHKPYVESTLLLSLCKHQEKETL